MLGKALRVSATVARGCAERVAARSGYGARSGGNFRWVLLRACAFTSGHTLCCAVLTTETHQILCGKYPPCTPRARHAPGFPTSQFNQMGAQRECLPLRGKSRHRRLAPPLAIAASVASESNAAGCVQRRGLFDGKGSFESGVFEMATRAANLNALVAIGRRGLAG